MIERIFCLICISLYHQFHQRAKFNEFYYVCNMSKSYSMKSFNLKIRNLMKIKGNMQLFIKFRKSIKYIILFCLLSSNSILSQGTTRTWLMDTLNNPSPGYISIVFAGGDNFFLVDNYGDQIYTRNIKQLSPFRFLDDGTWLLQGIKSYYIMNQNYQLIDSFPFPSELKFDFHEVNRLSNGNIIATFLEHIVMDMGKYVEGGSKDATVKSAVLVELNNKGEIKWIWKAIEHLDILDATEDVNLKQKTIDFCHANSICEDLDGNIIVSFRFLDEVTKINKSTGEIIWRMGGSKCKNNQFKFENDDNGGFFGFSHQHTASILPNGNLLLFDNGNLRIPTFSRAVEYQVDEKNKQVTKVWEYRNTPDIYSNFMGSVKRLPNGNTLINWGIKKISEIKPDKSIAMELLVNDPKIISLYRADKVYSHLDVVSKNISANGKYYFAGDKYETGMNLKINNLSGSDKLTIEYHKYKPSKAEYQDSNISEIVPARWVFSSDSSMTIEGKISFNTAFIDTNINPSKVSFYKRDKESKGLFRLLQTNFNKTTNEVEASFTGLGEFILVNHKLQEVQLISPEKNSTAIGLDAYLTWQNLAGAENYHLQVSSSIDFTNLEIDDVIDNLTANYKFSNFKNDTKYYWRVRASNNKDTSQWSEVFEFTTEMKSPDGLTPDNGQIVEYQGKLNWNNYYSGVQSSVQISKDSSFKELVIDAIGINDNSLNYDLIPNESYYWRVKTYKTENSSNWSNIAYFKATDETDVDESNILNNKLLYPNPSNEYLYLNDENIFQKPYKIIDMKGNIIDENVYRDGIMIKNISPGTYLLVINNKKHKFLIL